MGAFPRYLLFQLPGWVIAGLAAGAVGAWGFVDPMVAGLLVLLWIVKDLALYPLVRRAYLPAADGAAALVGHDAVACGDLAPRGHVRVRGELWQAELLPGEAAVGRGERLEVRAVDGRVLRVGRRRRAPG